MAKNQVAPAVAEGPEPLDAALDLMRRLPPAKVVENLDTLIKIVPGLADDLLSSIDLPLRSLLCPSTELPYLICDYNRDGDSYRSPHSNVYHPSIGDAPAAYPSEKLRNLEINANQIFDMYRRMYFEGGLSSVYLWDLEDGFAGIVLIQKSVEADEPTDPKGTWDSIHIFEITNSTPKKATYKLTSTVMLHLQNPLDKSSNLSLNGSLTRQVKSELALEASDNAHTLNMGRMVETMEGHLREIITSVYFDRTRGILAMLRIPGGDVPFTGQFAPLASITSPNAQAAVSALGRSTSSSNESGSSAGDIRSRIAAAGRRVM